MTMTTSTTLYTAGLLVSMICGVAASVFPALAAVELGVAGQFAILTSTGVTDVPTSSIVGDVGSSPITGAAILVSCPEVTGTIYSVDAAGPAPCAITASSLLTTAVGDMNAAYTDVSGRADPLYLNLKAGAIGGDTLEPGLYKWTNTVNITADITIEGTGEDLFLFQVDGKVNLASDVKVFLSGGVLAKNIFWAVAETVNLGTNTHFEGNILAKTDIAFMTGASLNGRALAQTAVTLQMNTIVIPAE